ncbi:MAG: hypothetical protein ACF787_01375 [Rhodopirellula sp. JB053]
MKPKALVGVMHCIENELDECLNSIRSQKRIQTKDFLISGKTNKEAHDELYQRFTESADQFEFFVKVDADMVLRSEHSLFAAWQHFEQRAHVQHLLIPVFDHFTQQNIYGLHAFRNTHRWEQTPEKYFVDMCDRSNIQLTFSRESAPIADHGPNPSLFQAYHYGLHKAVKVLQTGRPQHDFAFANAHFQNFRRLKLRHHSSNTLLSAMPVIGFLDAILMSWSHEHVDFNNPNTCKSFGERKKQSVSELNLEIKELERLNSALIESKVEFNSIKGPRLSERAKRKVIRKFTALKLRAGMRGEGREIGFCLSHAANARTISEIVLLPGKCDPNLTITVEKAAKLCNAKVLKHTALDEPPPTASTDSIIVISQSSPLFESLESANAIIDSEWKACKWILITGVKPDPTQRSIIDLLDSNASWRTEIAESECLLFSRQAPIFNNSPLETGPLK